MSDPVDFINKIDPVIKDYILDLRETLRRSKEELKAIGLERDALIARLEEIQKEKMSEQNQAPLDARTLSPKDYLKFKREMRRDMRLKEYDEKMEQAFADGQKDVREMNPEEYKEWKLRRTRRKAW